MKSLVISIMIFALSFQIVEAGCGVVPQGSTVQKKRAG